MRSSSYDRIAHRRSVDALIILFVILLHHQPSSSIIIIVVITLAGTLEFEI
jgi:hypothetical protein